MTLPKRIRNWIYRSQVYYQGPNFLPALYTQYQESRFFDSMGKPISLEKVFPCRPKMLKNNEFPNTFKKCLSYIKRCKAEEQGW